VFLFLMPATPELLSSLTMSPFFGLFVVAFIGVTVTAKPDTQGHGPGHPYTHGTATMRAAAPVR
jgi:hypothetical protein